MERTKHIGMAIMLAVISVIFCAVSFTYADDANRYWGYTRPELYREGGTVGGHFEYEGYPIFVVKVDENGEAVGEEQVVYCFNLLKGAPNATWTSKAERNYYTRVAGSGDIYLNYASNKKLTADVERKLLNVLYKGFPNNGTGIQEKYSLNEEQFRYITQDAVWHYTDEGPATLSTGTTQMKAAYLELINEDDAYLAAEEQRGEKLTLEFFISDSDRKQNLIGTTFKTVPEIENPGAEDGPGNQQGSDGDGDKDKPETDDGRLTISKTVTGNAGDRNEIFIFQIVLTDKDGKSISGTFNSKTQDGTAGTVTFSNGSATINLAHGESFEIEALPHEYEYSVKEIVDDKAGYVTYINGVQDSDRGTEGEGTEVSLAYENHKDAIIDTGISGGLTAVLAAMMILEGVLVFLIIRERRKVKR